MERIQHFSHDHPLILSDERIENEIDCDACDEPISGLTYSCTLCKFNLHKWCAELPRQLQHPIHRHSLTLLFSQIFSNEFSCKSCDRVDFGFRFNCADCQFHVQCASLPAAAAGHDAFQFHGQEYHLASKVSTNYDDVLDEINNTNYDDDEDPLGKTNRLLAHLQRINLHRSKPFGNEDSPQCFICSEPCRGPTLQSFNHNNIYHYFHVRCALLPQTVKHPCHRHRLPLMPSIEAADELYYYCNFCEQERNPRNWIYGCLDCNLAAHISCANSDSEVIPHLNLFSSSPLYVNVIERIKEIRKENVLSTLNNVSLRTKAAIESVSGKRQMLRQKEVRASKREKERETKTKQLLQLEHFCHQQHPLTLFEEEKNDAVPCNGCRQPISGLTYICDPCKFYLHKLCADLPREIQHPHHQEHALSLTAKEHEFKCMVCGFDCCSGCLSFHCNICEEFDVELQCALIHDGYKHGGHKHQLSIIRYTHYNSHHILNPFRKIQGEIKVRYGYMPNCNACGDPCEGLALECFGCKFHLHTSCATAPPITKLKFHRHPIVLNYSLEEEEDSDAQYGCDACEKERKPNRWVYKCAVAECNFAALLSCWNLP